MKQIIYHAKRRIEIKFLSYSTRMIDTIRFYQFTCNGKKMFVPTIRSVIRNFIIKLNTKLNKSILRNKTRPAGIFRFEKYCQSFLFQN